MRPDFVETLPMRAADTNSRPNFEIPPHSCDTHFHVFEPGYPNAPDPLYTFPEGTAEQYVQMADWLGLERMVLVQPTYYGTDNRLLVDTLRRLGPRCRGVVRIDDDTDDSVLDAYHEVGVRALRLDLFARAEWPLNDLTTYIHDMTEHARRRDWHLQFYAPGAVVRDLLPFFREFDHPFVIDHMGYMKESEGLTADDFGRLLEVMARGFCFVKLSGPYRLAGDKPLSSVDAIGTQLVSSRADRLIWGSDWPHIPNGQRDTGELLNLLANWAPREEDRHQILVDTPAQLFFDGET